MASSIPADTAKTTSAAAGSTASKVNSTTGASSTGASTGASSTKPAAGAGPKPTGGNAKANLEALSKTNEFRWFVAHTVVVVSTLLAIIPYFRASKYFYRLGIFAELVSFGIILFQKYGLKVPPFKTLLHDDNFQYAIITLFWLFTKKQTLALLPLAIFSLFHTLTYTRSYILPAVGRADSPLSKQIDDIVKRFNEPLTVLAANFEIALILHLILNSLFFVKGSWTQLIVYVAFIRLRFATSAYTRHAAKAWEIRADQLFGYHPISKEYWGKAKQVVAKIPGPANRV